MKSTLMPEVPSALYVDVETAFATGKIQTPLSLLNEKF